MSVGNHGQVDALLARLERVKQFGNGWRARCPAHEGKSQSLSVSVGHDGRILLHCFAGCSAASVLAAVGLGLDQLFPERPRDVTPESRREDRERARASRIAAAVATLSVEAAIVHIAAECIARGESLDGEDRARLASAVERIDSAREVLNGRH